MVVNVQRLRGKIVEKNNTQESVADAMGINRSTFYRKMKNGGSGFTIGDIHSMVKCIPLTKEEAVEIFFS
ncbi:MAG: helix-turn-helix transcriptional regulator [Lachnospiraceae bacterium]|nr:helix-turn-helix transcriptional regulator [Lachnospiraceae bacterium]